MSLLRSVITILAALLVLVSMRAAPVFAQQAPDDLPQQPPASPAPETKPTTSGPKDVFVPTEKIGAGAVVAFPVDI